MAAFLRYRRAELCDHPRGPRCYGYLYSGSDGRHDSLIGAVGLALIYLAFVATALGQLFPSSFSSWLLRNRRYVGLSFAAGFGWQAVFILVLLGLHGDYYATVLHDTTEFISRMLSYVLLIALAVTSFFPIRRAMDPRHWLLLHRVGIWYFWAAIWVSYAETVMTGDTRVIAIAFVAAGLRAHAALCGLFEETIGSVLEQTPRTTTPQYRGIPPMTHALERFPLRLQIYGDKTVFVCEDRSLSFSELDALSNRLASALLDLGVQVGDRVTLYSANCWEWVVSYYGILKTGPWSTPSTSC